jgi:hypothetical protein
MGWFPPTRYQLKGIIMKFNGNTKITLFSINLDPTVVPNVQIDFSKKFYFWGLDYKTFLRPQLIPYRSKLEGWELTVIANICQKG